MTMEHNGPHGRRAIPWLNLKLNMNREVAVQLAWTLGIGGHPGEQTVQVEQKGVLVASRPQLQADTVLRVPPRRRAGPSSSTLQERAVHQRRCQASRPSQPSQNARLQRCQALPKSTSQLCEDAEG